VFVFAPSPDPIGCEIIVVNNASSDETDSIVDEPARGLVVARETGRLATRGDILAFVDADCRAPIPWLQRIERRFLNNPKLVPVTGSTGRFRAARRCVSCGKTPSD
jgi:glycosyltransferase involved in cell wall biosynthesis